jgi:hypothetical protein
MRGTSCLKNDHAMSDAILNQLRDIIQEDVGKRGLRTDPERNLVNACPGDFTAACHSLAIHPAPGLAVVTGFFIPTATPPAGETDGPLGALFLARALVPLGIPVVLVTDDFCTRSLEVGLAACGLQGQVPVVTLPAPSAAAGMSDGDYWRYFEERTGMPALTHMLAIERVGPTRHGRCHTMRGRDITAVMSPAQRLFAPRPGIATIGIGDGGNEIGMGKIPYDVIDRNIPNGGLVACAVATDHLIVCGVSNWGAYALAAGVALVRKANVVSSLFDPPREHDILTVMVEQGGLVDGVLGRPAVSVDGLTWEQYAGVLARIGAVVAGATGAIGT